jgi:para-nitrobenzyl esterase
LFIFTLGASRMTFDYGRRWLAAGLAGLALSGCALAPGRVGYLVKSPTARPIVVATRQGQVRGVATPLGQAFLGIPFAAPPVGELRFAPPAPPAAWTAVRDATRAGAICPQGALPGSGRQSEDCLTLNVYAPRDADPARPRPVMVWLYGGGFESGDNVTYDPSRLAERQGVLVVAPNYRLGAFGFLAHPALRGPGEGAYALLDQQAALRWVRDNIAGFGGDPHNVTLFGESAGGWSVCYQLTAPGAAGLFQRAIIESGACASPLSVISLADAEAGGARLAAEVGCGQGADVADCLRRAPAKALLKARASRRGLLGLNSWSPAYGGDVLPEAPRTAFEAGRFAAVPVIDWTNHDEGRLFLYTNRLKLKLFTQASYEKILTDAFEDLTPKVIAQYAAEARRSRGLAYADVVTDSTFSCPALTLNGLLERRTPVHAYEFDDPEAATNLPPTPITPPLKAYHGSEVTYVFQTPWLAANGAALSGAQRALSVRMQGYWGAFGRGGDPNGAGPVVWPADTGHGPMRVSPAGIEPTADFASAHHCAFWNSLGY